MAWDGAVEAMSDEDRLNALDAGGVGAWRWDAAGSVFQLSPRACALVGAQKSRVPYPEFLALLHPEDCSAFDLSFRATHWPTRPGKPISASRHKPSYAGGGCAGVLRGQFLPALSSISARPPTRRLCGSPRLPPRPTMPSSAPPSRGLSPNGIAAPRRFSAIRRTRSSASRFPFFCCRTRGRSTTAFSAA